MCVGNSKCGGKRRRETDRRPSAKEKKMSPASSPLVPVTSRPLSLFGATEESASAVVHFCTHLTDGRRSKDDDDNGWSQGCARKRRRKDQLFFSRVQPRPPSLPPHLFRPLRFAEFSTWAGFRKKREKPYTPRSPHTTFEKEAVLCQILSEAEGNDCFFAPFLCRVRAA